MHVKFSVDVKIDVEFVALAVAVLEIVMVVLG